jgi:hypothetical protein
MFVDDIHDRWQTRVRFPCPLLWCEKRVKDFLADFLRDTATGGVAGDKNLPDFLRIGMVGESSPYSPVPRVVQAIIVLNILSMNGVIVEKEKGLSSRETQIDLRRGKEPAP